jgi:predicted DNA-binding antitoxin AbrB/MazE fold protein
VAFFLIRNVVLKGRGKEWIRRPEPLRFKQKRKKWSMRRTNPKSRGGVRMSKTIRARFSKGIIEPLEKVDIDEGKEITVTIIEIPAPSKKEDALEASAGGWKGLIDAEELIKNIYDDRLISTRPGVKL